MIKIIQSPRLKLPIVYLVETDDDLKQLPLGIPFIKANISDYNKIVQMMEWEVLWKAAIRSGLPFDWKTLLESKGFKTWNYGKASSESGPIDIEGDLTVEVNTDNFKETSIISCEDFLNDTSYKVDLEVLKELHLLPVWFKELEEAVTENITKTVVYNTTLYTKKLGMPLGDYELQPIKKNVIIIDISNSIPRSITNTCLILSKTLSEMFYADILITGLKSTLYEYGGLDSLTTEKLFRENGGGNEQAFFRKLVSEPREYKTAIVFGDYHQPGQMWRDSDTIISREQGRDVVCKWNVENIISLHTTSNSDLAGYGTWFNVKPENIKYMRNWVKYLNN